MVMVIPIRIPTLWIDELGIDGRSLALSNSFRESKSAGRRHTRYAQLQQTRSTSPRFASSHLRATVRAGGKLDRKLLYRESVAYENEHALEKERVAARP